MGSIPVANDFEIITTLLSDRILLECPSNVRLDPDRLEPSQFYLLDHHRDRMLAAVKAFQWPEVSQTQILGLKDHLQAHLKEDASSSRSPLRLRVALSSTGSINISSAETNAVPPSSLFPTSLSSLVDHSKPGSVPSFRVFISSEPTKPSLFTNHKTSWRKPYDDLRANLPFKKSQTGFPEILLFNYQNEIMEGSICTPYFFRGGHWTTPNVSCGGNVGTTRRYALEHGVCKEGIVMKDSVKVGERVVLSNGVRGFGWGIVEDTRYSCGGAETWKSRELWSTLK